MVTYIIIIIVGLLNRNEFHTKNNKSRSSKVFSVIRRDYAKFGIEIFKKRDFEMVRTTSRIL